MTRLNNMGGLHFKQSSLAATLMLIGAASSGTALAVNIDGADVMQYSGTTAPPPPLGAGPWVDRIGTPIFESGVMSINLSGNFWTVTIPTNWQFGTGPVNSTTADVFFRNENTGAWVAGLETLGPNAGNVYTLGGADPYDTSYDAYTGCSGCGYSGEWNSGAGSNGLIPTSLGPTNTYNQLATINKVAGAGDAGATTSSGPFTGYLQFTLDVTALGVAAGSTLGVLWGTANCGNDTVYIADTVPSTVPVPAAVWLLGSALAGMGTIGGWRRRAERSAA